MNEALVYTFHQTPFGHSLIACTNSALVHTALRPQQDQISQDYARLGYQPIQGENKVTEKVRNQLDEYFAGKRKRFTVPLQFHGTDFQKKVWELVTEIPYGEVMAYSELAIMANHPRASRAVGTAMAKNRIPILVPCHRVIPVNRKIGNYTGGVDIKDQLLRLEGVKL